MFETPGQHRRTKKADGVQKRAFFLRNPELANCLASNQAGDFLDFVCPQCELQNALFAHNVAQSEEPKSKNYSIPG